MNSMLKCKCTEFVQKVQYSGSVSAKTQPGYLVELGHHRELYIVVQIFTKIKK